MSPNYYTIIIGFFIGFFLFFRLPKLKKRRSEGEADNIRISVIIPARNEEDNLPNILSDLKKQTYDLYEIICVDDNSEDATAQVIQRFGAICIQLDSLPEGWKGKPWACQNGAKAASGDLLLFIDADVRLSATAVESLASRFCLNGRPISVQPYHIVKKQHEYFSLFFNLIQICATAMSILGSKKRIGFYGPLLMIPKELFDAHGGYEVVKNNVVEDFNLGKYYNSRGIDMDLFLGAEEVQFRMYPNSFSQVFEGWAKNFSSGSISIRPWLLVLVVAWIAFLTAVPFEIIRAYASGDSLPLVLLIVLYAVSVLFLYRNARQMGSYPFYPCLFYPVYLAAFHIIFFYSIYATFVVKSTTWKGRKM